MCYIWHRIAGASAAVEMEERGGEGGHASEKVADGQATVYTYERYVKWGGKMILKMI